MTLASSGPVEVSVVVPAADEADNLPEFVRQCADALRDVPYACEVVIVNDGSQDDTAAVLGRLAAEHPFLRVATHRSRRGIADALRTAGEIADGEIFVFYPADLQFLPAEIPRLVEPIRAGEADIVTGTKRGEYDRRSCRGCTTASAACSSASG
jgi:dolichol-phosphate mannosyltransferase